MESIKMEFDGLKKQAEQLGFKFEWRAWVPDDYEEDEDGVEHLITEEVSAWKVTFPADWPRLWEMIVVGEDNDMCRSLQAALNEYENRYKIRARDEEFSRNTEIAVKRLWEMIKGGQ